MGGIGKSALALVLAHEWAPSFPDAQLFLNARGTQPNPPSSTDLMAQVIQAFHPTEKLPDDEAQLKASYHDVLHGRRVLILMDNASDAAQAAPLIPPDGCAFIVTSRRGFTLGTTAAYFVGKLSDGEAIALLRSFHPDINSTDASELARLCAGLPLALRIAGAQIAMDASERSGKPNVSAYLSALRNGRLDTLDANAPDAGEVTISETIRLSEAQLTPGERDAWRKLGVLSVSFDESAASSIAGTDVSILKNLVRRSLLEREGEDRYKMHELADDYAQTAIGEASVAETHFAHARHYTSVAWEAGNLYFNGEPLDGLDLFDRERPHLEVAYRWLSGAEMNTIIAQQIVALVDATAYTGALRFYPSQRIEWLTSQLQAARYLNDRKMEGYALGNIGIVYENLDDMHKAIEVYEQRLRIAHEIDDPAGERFALAGLGRARFSLSELGCIPKACESVQSSGDAAIKILTERLIEARKAGNQREESQALVHLGDAHLLSSGEGLKAIELYAQALAVSHDCGDKQIERRALVGLGLAHEEMGDLRKALEYQAQSLLIRPVPNDQLLEGRMLGKLGLMLVELGCAAKAIEACEHALAATRAIGDQRGECYALFHSALANYSLENRPEAIICAEAALPIAEAIEDPAAAGIRAKLSEWRGE